MKQGTRDRATDHGLPQHSTTSYISDFVLKWCFSGAQFSLPLHSEWSIDIFLLSANLSGMRTTKFQCIDYASLHISMFSLSLHSSLRPHFPLHGRHIIAPVYRPHNHQTYLVCTLLHPRTEPCYTLIFAQTSPIWHRIRPMRSGAQL